MKLERTMSGLVIECWDRLLLFQIFFDGLRVAFQDFTAHVNSFNHLFHHATNDGRIGRIKESLDLVTLRVIDKIRKAILNSEQRMHRPTEEQRTSVQLPRRRQ